MTRRRTIFLGVCLTLAMGLLSAVGPSSTATAVGVLNGQKTGRVWAQLSAGGNDTCGIRRDHTLWCWGDNSLGQLGMGDKRNRYTPTQVGTGTDWASMSNDQNLWMVLGEVA